MLPSSLTINVGQRELHALVLLCQEIFFQLDELAALKKKGESGKLSALLLGEMCSVLPELEPRLFSAYKDLFVLSACMREPIRGFTPSEDYVTSTLPSRQRLMSHLREELVGCAA
jgi:hypothetical protein